MKEYKTFLPKIRLIKEPTAFPNVKIGCSLDGANFIRGFYHDDLEIFESFYLLLLNNANKTIGYVKISQGGIVGTVVDVRIICKYAIEALAVGCIMAHNHPSGKLQPSEQDKQLTKKVKQAFEILDIKLLDHLIITADSFYSFTDEGIL